MNMTGMNMAGMNLMSMASGTSMNPQSWRMPMGMARAGGWNLMFMGNAFVVETQQAGPRGGDKLYSVNWGMVSAEHRVGRGSVMLQTMLSLEPATVTARRYPLLFQTGETAFGGPIVDGQHPHNFVMGLGVQYARPLGSTILQVYYAPVGDPALGPVAFPHRASAFELPQAPLSHHWQDSTHIATNVITVALKRRKLRLEASGFLGAEPGEQRWRIAWGAPDSYSARFSVFATRDWMFQASAGRLHNPEAHAPGDVIRVTASAHYTRAVAAGDWSTSLIWGRNHSTATQRNLNSWLAETLYPLTRRNILTARAELVAKDELFANIHELEHELEHRAGSTFRIGAFTGGYTREIATLGWMRAALGANASAYSIPPAIKPYYGEHPWGVGIFLRVRLQPQL